MSSLDRELPVSVEAFLIGGEKLGQAFPLLLKLPQGHWQLHQSVQPALPVSLLSLAPRLESAVPCADPVSTSSQPLEGGTVPHPELGAQRGPRVIHGPGGGPGPQTFLLPSEPEPLTPH